MATLTALAEEALVQAKKLDAYCVSVGRPLTSFDKDTLDKLPPDVATARDTLLNSSHTLKRLAQGPLGIFNEYMWVVSQSSCDSSTREKSL